MIQRIHGVNVAVKELEAAVNTYRRLAGQEPRPLDREDFAFPGLRGAAFQLGETVINLVSSEREDTSIARFLRTRGEGLFLVSLLSDAVTEDVEALRQRGFAPVLPETAVGEFGRVNFIHPKSLHGVQIEVYQPPTPETSRMAGRPLSP